MKLLWTSVTLLLQMLAYCMQLASGQNVIITVPPMNTSVIIGDSFTLTCVAEGGTITWERDNVLVGNGLLVGYDLVFMEALPDHTGIYECIARNGSEETRAAATVTVSYPPVFVSLVVEPSDEVINGTMVTFNCTMNGFPTPNVTWFHNGDEVVNSSRVIVTLDGILILVSVHLSDAGMYSCNGTNIFGTLVSDIEIMLRVYFPPINIMIHGSPPDFITTLGDSMVVTCNVFSMPQSIYTWWKEEGEGNVIVYDSHDIMIFNGNGTLLFTMIQREDAGRYYCSADNGYGNISSDYININIIAVPLPPIGITTSSPTAYTVYVDWVATPSYPTVGSYIVEYRLDDRDDREWLYMTANQFPTSLLITDLLPYGRYQLRISALSPAGQGGPSDILIFMTDTGVPLDHNTTETADITSVSSRSIIINWTIHLDIIFTSYTFANIELTTSSSTELHSDNVSGSGYMYEVSGLIPNTLYCVSLRLSFVGGFMGPEVQLQTTTLEDVPESPPQNITATIINSASVMLSWLPPLIPNGIITSYNVSYMATNNISEIYTETVIGEESILLTGLCPFTTYNVSISASTAVGEGPSQSINVTTLQEAPQPPTIIMSRAISSTQLMLSWQLEGKVPGIISGYNVTYMTLDSEEVIVIKLGPSNESIFLNDLEVWSQYNVCINAATEGGGPGEPSCIIRRTLSAAPVLQLVIESVIPLCPPSLLVTWQPVTSDLLSQLNGPIEDTVYTIQWNDEMEDIRFNISTTEFIIPDLMLETEYTVSLAVTNSNGTGPISEVIQVTTPPPGAPGVSDVTLIPDETSILVSWEAPPTDSTHLQYIYNLNIMDVININITNTSYTITGLTPATEYIVLVKADSGCGFGQSVSMTTNTLESLPGPPVVTIVTVSSSSVSLKLEEPLMPNGLITYYMVMCGEESSVAVEVIETYYVCMDLKEEMLITITVWAVNSAGDGDIITINTMTACKSTNPKVDISDSDDGDDVIVTVELSTSCPNEDYVLIVVMEITDQEQQRPLSTYSIDELIMLTEQYDGELQRRQVTMATIYIAANLSRQEQFQLGDGMKYGEYINYGLKREVKYVVGVVAVSENSTNPTITMTSSDFIVPVVPDGTSTDDNSQGFPIHLAAGAGGGIILILVVVIVIAISILVCCRKRRRGAFNPDMQGKGSSHSFERGASVRISGRRGNKPTDPVEEYRANYHTEALESHIPVPINGFINKLLVMRTNDNQLFLEEFGSIEMAPQQPCSIAELPGNRAKNRYHNILPYDHSRVKLSHSKGQSEYINASYCSGFMKVQGFVATQGPLPDTVPDFWRVVWEQNSRTIVMLTNAQERLKTKCEVYWPREVGCSAVHSGIEVTLTDFTQLADYTIRSLTLTKAGSGKEVREVRQFHFTSWPDHGVPQYATAMLAMVRRVQAFHTSDNGPMIVHCSAGVGRTGTFIVIYSMLERMKAQRNTIDIYGHVSLLRTQRNYMVQTEDQYFFIYEAVAEVIVCGDTEVPIDLLEEYVTDILSVAHEHSDNTNIELEFKRLAVDKSDAYRFVSANKDVNKAKNRYVNVLPYETRRVVLQYQRAQEGSDYINASFIDGYHYRNAFIATQGPLQNTLADFWRMVWENNVPLIVMLTKCHEKGTERSAKYWPSEVGQSLMCGHYKVEMTVERKSEHYTYRDILLIDIQNGRKRQLRHFHYLSWPEVGVPSSSIVLLDFLREIQKNFATLNTKSPITVHCSNGIGRSGIFIALHIILERMVAEGLVDVFQTIKNLRIQRPAMVQTLEQYQFCYTLALDYLESSDLINQLRSSTRSDSIRAPSNSSELRSSRRSLNRNDSLRSSAKRSSRNLEMTNASNGVTTTVYGGSEATSTFGTTNQQQQLTVGGDEERQISPLPPSPTHHLLTNPHLAHLDHGGGGASQLSQSSITSAQGSSSITQSNTLPIRGGGTSGFMQSHWGMAPTSSSQTSLSRSTAAQPPPSALSQGGGGAYPISSFKSRNSGGPNTSQDSLDQQFATLALNINNSNNCTSHVVDVYIEP